MAGSDDEKRTLTGFDQALKNVWTAGLLGDYDFLSPWNNHWVDIYKLAFSLFTTIMITNILSMSSQVFFFYL